MNRRIINIEQKFTHMCINIGSRQILLLKLLNFSIQDFEAMTR